MKSPSELKILEVGEFSLFKRTLPDQTTLVFTGQYLSNIPYSIYTRSSFWTDSPTLVVMRGGISLLLLAGSYLWTQYCAGPGWSWMQTLGKNYCR